MTSANPDTTTAAANAFIQRWQHNTASELATAQSFVMDLCELLGVTKPHPTPEQDYMFERPVTFAHGDGSTSAGRIDCYRRGHFVLEAKKLKASSHIKGFDDGLLRARSQGEAYARALPAADGRPPFVLVVDVGTVIEVYAEFSKTGGTYTPTPTRAATACSWQTWPGPRCKTACAASGPTPTASTPRASAPRSPATWPPCWPSWPSRWKAPTTALPKISIQISRMR